MPAGRRQKCWWGRICPCADHEQDSMRNGHSWQDVRDNKSICSCNQYWQLPGRKSGFLFAQYSLPMLITCRRDVGENVGREESVPVLIMSRIQCAMGIPGRTSGITKVFAVAYSYIGLHCLMIHICICVWKYRSQREDPYLKQPRCRGGKDCRCRLDLKKQMAFQIGGLG